MSSVTLQPIGAMKSVFHFKNGTPRQSSLCDGARGVITIDKSIFNNPEHSLEGLEQFSHAWIIFVFHKNNNSCTKAKVKPPRLNGQRVGVFSTRSPYRPSNIGLSLVKIEKVEGASVYVSGIDILDGSPVLDIKPYIPEYDKPKEELVPSVCDSNSDCHMTADVSNPVMNVRDCSVHSSLPDQNSRDSTVFSSLPYPNVRESSVGSNLPDPNIRDSIVVNSLPDPNIRDSIVVSSLPNPNIRDINVGGSFPDQNIRDSSVVSSLLDLNIIDSRGCSSLPDPHIRDSDVGSSLLDPNIRDSRGYSSLPDPTIRDSNVGSSLPDPIIRDNNVGSSLPDPIIRDSNVGSSLPDPIIRDSNVGSSLPDPIIRDSRGCTNLPDPDIRDRACSSLPEQTSKVSISSGDTVQTRGVLLSDLYITDETAEVNHVCDILQESLCTSDVLPEEVTIRETGHFCQVNTNLSDSCVPKKEKDAKISLDSREFAQTIVASWLLKPPVAKLDVIFTSQALEQLQKFSRRSTDARYQFEMFSTPEEAEKSIADILREEPRSVYRRQRCQDSLYYFAVDVLHVTCWFDGNIAQVVRIKPVASVPMLQPQTE